MQTKLRTLTARLGLATALGLSLQLASLPVAAQGTPKIVKKTPLDFPPEAIRSGVDKGVLRAKLTIDGEGAVTDVTVVDVQPPQARVLRRTVVEGLRPWKFEAGKAGSFEMQVVMSNE
ncbi:hypothetical protein IP87_12595 [beta proteobacterium AAP121]|nr:hypothetical protein IP80_13035 [beta proteobacterium AAP65]KPF97106.1 hypothetical protein IP87_12595 [beta proteobacterium AAP121]